MSDFKFHFHEERYINGSLYELHANKISYGTT